LDRHERLGDLARLALAPAVPAAGNGTEERIMEHRLSLDMLRAYAVEALATARYGPPDPEKSTQKTAVWKTTEHGTLLVNRLGNFFRFDPERTDGLRGAGALDWLIKVEGLTAKDAVQRLQATPAPAAIPAAKAAEDGARRAYTPVADHPAAWPAVRRYLTQDRTLPPDLVDRLRADRRIRAARWGGVPYAVFPLRDAAGQEVGAVLRCAGTPAQQQAQAAAGYALKRVAPGSDVKIGYWSPYDSPAATALVLVEAPLDAVALWARFRVRGTDLNQVAIRATTGAAVNAQQWADRAWAHVYAAFDADAAGDRLAERVTVWGQTYGVPVHRVVPSGAKDWAAAWETDSANPEFCRWASQVNSEREL